MLPIAVRAVVLVLAWTVLTRAADARAESAQDSSGFRLLVFAVLAVASALWAALDGWRGTPLASLLIRWALATVALGVYVPLVTWWPEPGADVGVLASDLIVVTPLIAGITFAPAAIAGAAGSLAAANRRARRRSRT